MCALIAFLGVIYAGFCSAILFAKFSHLLGRAHVAFSSTIVIQYNGEHEQHDTDRTSADSSGVCFSGIKSTPSHSNSFPVAEFRIINTRANELGCEIIDAKVSCLVCINYSSEP